MEPKWFQLQEELYGPGYLEVVAVGMFSAELQLISGNKATKDIYVLKEQKEALLGRPAIQGLDMIQRSTWSQNQKMQDRRWLPHLKFTGLTVKEKYPELFLGLGKLER